MLRDERGQTCGERQNEERDFFEDQSQDRRGAWGEARSLKLETRCPAERPEIEQQEHEGQRDEHGFAHQSQRKADQGQPVAAGETGRIQRIAKARELCP